MNRTRILKSSLLILVVFAVLIGAAVVAQATALNSSAASGDVTRQPRPHPKSHIKMVEPGSALSPRPHPTSHLAVTPVLIGFDGIARSPRPHPTSHIEILVNRP
ncbi:MAG: hypothetical protein HGB05_12705 [Chloroflexi bacterium]|nr:hypothetical protein [Chloroflexota bacterium]